MISQRRASENALIRKRMEVVFLVFLAVVLIVAGRLVQLQWFRSRSFIERANQLQIRVQTIGAERGRILDRNGNPLALDVLTKTVAVNPKKLPDPAAAADRLALLLGLKEEEREALRRRLVRAHERGWVYTSVRKGVERKTAERVLAGAKQTKALQDEDGRPLLWLTDYPTRVNPSGRDGIQLVGAVQSSEKTAERTGLEALELRLNAALQGTDGKRRIRVDATETPIPESEDRLAEPINGRDVTLTIDRNIQHFVEEELSKLAAEQSPDAATAIVMDIPTGEILAMANWPTYDPDTKKAVRPEQRRNRAVTDLAEPGSTFKVFTAAAALEYRVPTDAYCGGRMPIGKHTVGCAHRTSHGQVDLRKMIQKSCNLAAGAMAERVGPGRLYDFLRKFGFLEKTGIEFPGEMCGWLPDPRKNPQEWPAIRVVNVGFGQGIATTPTRLLAAYAAIANDGMYVPPRLVLSAPGVKFPKREARRVISSRTAATLSELMETVVEEGGTGTKARVEGYRVAGKTGTAQLLSPTGRGYGGGYLASFVGFLPVSKPRLAILVSVWRPRKGQYGGTVAAPVFGEIARQSAVYLRIPPDAPVEPPEESRPARATVAARVPDAAAGTAAPAEGSGAARSEPREGGATARRADAPDRSAGQGPGESANSAE